MSGDPGTPKSIEYTPKSQNAGILTNNLTVVKLFQELLLFEIQYPKGFFACFGVSVDNPFFVCYISSITNFSNNYLFLTIITSRSFHFSGIFKFSKTLSNLMVLLRSSFELVKSSVCEILLPKTFDFRFLYVKI